MRSVALLAVAATLACSKDDSNAFPPAFHRDCVAPVALACKGLTIVTPRQPISPSDMPVGDVHARHGQSEAFQAPALLQRYVIDGTPPRFRATSNSLLTSPNGYGEMVTDGDGLFAYDQTQDGTRYHAWDASGVELADVAITDEIPGNQDGIAAFGGLAMVHHANYGPTDRMFLYDAHGILGWSREGGIAASSPFSYGCGFALRSDSFSAMVTLTTLPTDGRPSLQQSVIEGQPSPWPYDAHAVAFVSTQVPPFTSDLDAGPCSATLSLVFDDGRAPVTRSYDRDCEPLYPQSTPTLVSTTSFGAVLHFGNGVLLLVDPDGTPVGSTVKVTLEGDEPTLSVVPIGDFIAVLVSEETFQPAVSTATMQTVIGCLP